MASYSFVVANGGRPLGIHEQLAGTAPDDVTVDCRPVASRVTIVNRGTTTDMFIHFNGTATVEGDNTIWLPPRMPYDLYVGSGLVVISLVGNGEKYSVQASPHGTW